MLLQKIEYHITGHAVVAGIHRELAKEVTYRRLYNNYGTQAVPKIIQGENTFSATQCTLVLQCNETAAQLYGPGSIFLQELIAEAEHMAGSQDGLSLLVVFPVLTQDVAVAAHNLLLLGIPYQDLLVRILACIKLVKVKTFASPTTSSTESYLAQTANLPDHIRRVLPCDHINLVAAFVGHTQLLIRRQFRLQHLTWNTANNLLHHISYTLFLTH